VTQTEDVLPGSPRYGHGTIGDVLVSAWGAVAGDPLGNPLSLPPAESYVVFLVDGLGWSLLHEHADAAPYLSGLAQGVEPITSGIPSTTATSITSLGTGLPPGSHGVVGFTSRIPGTDRLLDALRWDADVDPRAWQVHDTIFGRAMRQGVLATVVSKHSFAGSGLTVASQRGAEYVGADTAEERIHGVVASSAVRTSLTYVYEGHLDATGHRNGCTSWAWVRQLSAVDSFAQRLRKAMPASATLVVTADHGMVDVGPESRIDVDAEPDLLAGVRLMGGEARFRHLYCQGGAVDEVFDAWRTRLGQDALVVTRDEAIALGWFGPVEAAVRPRLGDVMVACVGDCAVVSTGQFPHEATLVGFHGSLTPDEMLIPLLVDQGR
jgi:hypothetical protein